ncbi:hypothetical protein HYPSUDRAFT_56500 [Hypholoma sublateritium FD-334 SS-4]|uniref:C2H2-type domain-containing protein n=1 Tax=Hypholoma sublateritium (strain FD-334 SS-4) TaxID=945553 RepID=A0A0D2NSQ4_HYPSF|nr:hypothetical protein HYPSUDRAFT_56500 [Hypholoma sublateritium FD-334 SS-4]
MGFKCNGCCSKFNHEADLIQHLEKVQHPVCKAAWHTVRTKMHPVKGGKHIPKQCPTAAEQHFHVPDPLPFEGDFFGNDYEDQDFPFPTHDLPEMPANLPAVDEGNNDSDTGSDSSKTFGSDGATKPAAGFLHTAVTAKPHPPQPVTTANKQVVPAKCQHPATQDPVVPAPTAPGGVTAQVHDCLRQPLCFIMPYPNMHTGVHSLCAAPVAAAEAGYSQYATQLGSDQNAWAPFASKMDWEVFDTLDLSFKSTAQLNKIIDTKLPPKCPEFQKHAVTVTGKMTEVYTRNVLACIKAQYGDPQHADYLVFKPECHYADTNCTSKMPN